MMTLKQIGASAAALGNQLAAGIPMDAALQRMSRLQPEYAEFWLHAMREIQSGHMLSVSLDEVWPQALISAVRAGEHSGKIEMVLAKIEETVELQLSLRGNIMKLAYPIGMGLAGLGVFIGFMAFVLPLLAKSLGARSSRSAIFQISAWISQFLHQYWMLLSIAIVVGVLMLVTWLKTEEARSAMLDLFLGVPLVKDALRDMYFGLWANYMAMMVSAGIPTAQSVILTAQVLPGVLSDSVLLFERDLSTNNRSLADSADPAKLPIDDLRTIWWPFYISNAFIVGDHTMDIEKELLRTAPSLLKEGTRTFNRVVAVANVVALAASGFLIVSPLAAYYSEVFSAIRTAGQ